MAGFYCKFLCCNLCFIEISFCEQLVEWLALAGYLQKKLGLYGFNLRITHHASLLYVLKHGAYGAVG